MGSLAKTLVFYDDGNFKREQENFQSYFFSKIDFSNHLIPISFVRSDFRGAKFQEMIFSKNNFSNSDFIDSTVIKTSFKKCQFKFAEIYNSYFEDSTFFRTVFDSTSFIKLMYINCELNKSKFSANTFRESKFVGCSIADCLFEKNSMDNIEFENTTFKNIDLSNMTAINLFFNNCNFENVIIDADYLGSYFFKGRFFTDLNLKYRGQILKLDISQSDLLNNLFKIFFEKERYYEAVNIAIQKNLLENKTSSIFSLIKVVIEHLMRETSQLKRANQFEKIFKLLEYYLNTGYIIIEDYFKIVGYLENQNIAHFEFIEQINFYEKVNRLKLIIENIDLSQSFIETFSSNEKMLLEVRIEEANREDFENYFKIAMSEIAKTLSLKKHPYKIVNVRHGSIIYDIVLYSSAALLFLKIIKSILKVTRETLHESIQLAIDYQINTKTLEIAKRVHGKKEIEEIREIKEIQLMSQKALSKSADEEDVFKKLLPLLKSAIVYPNALTKGKK